MIYFDRGTLIQIFEDTLFLCQGETLKNSVKKSIGETILYEEESYPALPRRRFRTTKITVNDCRTFEAAKIYSKKFPKSKITVQNFASAVSVGGGVARGNKAQEESLCRCSTLYPVLKTANNLQNFYNYHYESHNPVHTDRLIYTPDIWVIKSDQVYPKILPEKEWFKVNVITCAAPNLFSVPNNFVKNKRKIILKLTKDELYQIHMKRGEHILTVAAHHGTDIFIGGAFGCGAFRNDPYVVAKAYKDLTAKFTKYFKEIVFAIYCPPKDDRKNFNAFNNTFNEEAENE